LKIIVNEFYSGEQICRAKDTLMHYMEKVNHDKWTCPPRRRKDSKDNVGNKMRQDVDDMISTMTFADENNIREKLPIFVAADPDLLPSVKLTDGDLVCVMNKLCNIDQTLSAVRSELLDGMAAGFGRMSSRASGTAIPSVHSLQFQPRQRHPVGSGTNLSLRGTQPSPALQWLLRGNLKPLSAPHPRLVAWMT